MSTELKNKIKNILGSRIFRGFIYGIGILLIASFIFRAGMLVGFGRASFGRDFGDNYERNFRGPERGGHMMGGMFREDLPNAHGAIGKIIKIDPTSITVLDGKDKIEKVIDINDKTEIRKMRDTAVIGDLKVDDFVVVIGVPNAEGQIEARLIRIMPEPTLINKDNINK